jgi:hypothetical protein
MNGPLRWMRKQAPGIAAVLLMVGMYLVSALPGTSAADSAAAARGFGFTPRSIALPSGYEQHEIRKVNKEYRDIDAWISSVGAGIALNDLDGDGLPNDLCISEPRIDQIVVTPAPDANAGRYPPFALDAAPLPMDRTMAPMGCAPGDFNQDGRMDLLAYYWGRTPIVFLARAGADGLTADSYRPIELVPHHGGKRYTGSLWNSNTVAIDDFDGDGHVDLYVGNYFPHSPVLDETKDGAVEMNRSLSRAANGGEGYFFRWTGSTAGTQPSVQFERDDDVLAEEVSRGWDLAAAANDLDGDQLPELYIANDHGTDALLHNRSKPGVIEFEQVYGVKSPLIPKSKRIGADSFKGMGVDYGDLNHDGLYDMFISNITTSFGIQESNLQFMSEADGVADLRAKLSDGEAPWTDRSSDFGTAWSGWCWDVKLADFNNDGDLEIAQTNGFVKGDVNRWAQLQELATANDLVLEHPQWWPNVRAGDDIAGSQRMHLFAPNGDRYTNIAPALGLDVPVPTRGIAIADTDGDGRLDFAIARQWDQPAFYQNTATSPGSFLGLRLTHPDGAPVVGAQVRVQAGDRTLINRVDGGGGHTGKRSTDVHIGLGEHASGPLEVSLRWRDRSGRVHEQDLQLTPGWHHLQLDARAEER